MNNYTFGIDLSIYQTDSSKSPKYFFNPAQAKEKGVQFAFIRASIGSAKDNAVDTFAKSFQAAELPHGFYHFLRSDVSYITQADRFLETIKQFDYQLPPVCDVEHTGCGLEITKAWCGRVSSKLGKKPIIYSSPGFWNSLKDVSKAAWALEYDHWIANYLKALSYPVYSIPDLVLSLTTFPTLLTPWAQADIPWRFWQFCAAGDGEFYGGDYAKHTDKTALDMNAFNGTLEEFRSFLQGQEAKAPEQQNHQGSAGEGVTANKTPPSNEENLALLQKEIDLLGSRIKNIETFLGSYKQP